jgi:multidrug efflux pump subunit AcrB
MRQLVNNLPLITLVILLFSFLNLHFFYGSFGIAVQNYLDVSEIVFSMTTFISSVVSLILFCLYLNIVLFSRKTGGRKENLNFKKGNNLSNNIKSSKYRVVRYLARLVEPGAILIFVYSGVIFILFYIVNSLTDEQLRASSREFDFCCYLLVSFGICCIWICYDRTDVDSSCERYQKKGL